MAQIGLYPMDLPDPPERLQMADEVRAAHRHPDAVIALAQGTDKVAPDKARAAEYGDERIERRIVETMAACRLADGLRRQYRIGAGCYSRSAPLLTRRKRSYLKLRAQVAELVDALVSGTSGATP